MSKDIKVETQILEFKQVWRDEYLKTLCAFIENWGRGTLNIINQCVEYGLAKPTFEYEWTSVKTTFYKTPQETAQKTAQKSTQEDIMELLKNNPDYTKQDLMQTLDKADGTIKQHISNLQKEGKLKRVGGRKLGHWEVIDE